MCPESVVDKRQHFPSEAHTQGHLKVPGLSQTTKLIIYALSRSLGDQKVQRKTRRTISTALANKQKRLQARRTLGNCTTPPRNWQADYNRETSQLLTRMGVFSLRHIVK